MSKPPAIPEPDGMTWEQLDLAVRARMDWHRDKDSRESELLFSHEEGRALWGWVWHYYRRCQPADKETQNVQEIIKRAAQLLKPSAMTAAALTLVIREWLDASPATEWGNFERALHGAITEGDADDAD